MDNVPGFEMFMLCYTDTGFFSFITVILCISRFIRAGKCQKIHLKLSYNPCEVRDAKTGIFLVSNLFTKIHLGTVCCANFVLLWCGNLSQTSLLPTHCPLFHRTKHPSPAPLLFHLPNHLMHHLILDGRHLFNVIAKVK